MHEAQRPPAIIENHADVSRQETLSELQSLLDDLQSGEIIGPSLENFLRSLPRGEQITLRIGATGTESFEVALEAGDSLENIIDKIVTQLQTSANRFADRTAGTDVLVDTSLAAGAVENAFRTGSLQDLRRLQLPITGSAMG